MPYNEHWLCSFGGALGVGTGEAWSCGIRLANAGAETIDEEEYLDVIAVPRISEWIVRADSHIGFGTHLNFVKFNKINPDGLYEDPGHPHTRFLDVAGGTDTSTLPFQACVVVTTRSNSVSAGPGSRGRFFSPYPAVHTGSTGLFNTIEAQEIADSAAILMDNLEDTGGFSNIRPHIMSQKYSTEYQIDYVTVDNRVDTQRRRANQLVAAKFRADIDYS